MVRCIVCLCIKKMGLGRLWRRMGAERSVAAGAGEDKQLFWAGAGIVVPKTRRAAAKMLAAGSEVWAQFTLWAEEEATTKGDSYGS